MSIETKAGDPDPVDLERSLRTTKALADRSRLLILNTLRRRPLCAEEIAAALDLAPSTVSFHLKKLAAADLVAVQRDQYYVVYSLRAEALRWTVDDLTGFANPEAATQESRTAEERRAVLRAFFNQGRLRRMPAQKRKRLIVTAVFAGLFEPGREYPESVVDPTIRQHYDDHCLVRRLLVDEGFFTRDHGVYRRTDKPGVGLEEIASAPRQPTPDRHAPDLPTPDQTKTDPAATRHARHGGRTVDERRTSIDERRKALKREYLLQGRRAGIFSIVNLRSGRALLGSSLDVRAALNRYGFELDRGSNRNRSLQDDYTRLGKEAFAFETVELLDDAVDADDVERELQGLEGLYAAAIDPERHYNTSGDLRVPPKPGRRQAR